ncbi:MAG: GNAT family protein [Bdellovibrionota bacterium]
MIKQNFQVVLDEETELKLLSIADADTLFETIATHRKYLRLFLPWLDRVQAPSDSEKFIEVSSRQFEEKSGMQVGIWFRKKFIGVIGFQKIDLRNRKVSLGFWLVESAQGHGKMTQVCLAMLKYAFNDLKLNRASLRLPSSNQRARKIAERLGFSHEGDLKQAEWFYDHFEDNALYGLLESTWRDIRR